MSRQEKHGRMMGTFHAYFARQGIHIHSIHAKNTGKSPQEMYHEQVMGYSARYGFQSIESYETSTGFQAGKRLHFSMDLLSLRENRLVEKCSRFPA
jgi:hypothetical protein